VASGGVASGGVASGGEASGGAASGGAASGGVASGGVASGGAASGGAAMGGAPMGGAASGGSAAGGTTGGAGGGGNGVDLTGTWISEVKTSGTLTVPVVGSTNADIDLVIRLSLSKANGKLNGTFNICRLTTTTTPDPNSLKVTFTNAVIATLGTTLSENDFTATVGAAVPVPDIEVLSGQDSSGKQVDSDNDGHPGDTVPSNIGGAIMLNAYTGFDIKISMASTLQDASTIMGTTNFTTSGTVFGSDNPLLTSGSINVTPSSKAVPFTAKKLAGDVACADVLKNF